MEYKMDYERLFWAGIVFGLVLGLSVLGFVVWVIIKLLQHVSVI